jgi:hypothetical protein
MVASPISGHFFFGVTSIFCLHFIILKCKLFINADYQLKSYGGAGNEKMLSKSK